LVTTGNQLQLPALIALAGLDGPWRAQVIDTLEEAVSDRLRSTHERYRAAVAVMSPQPSESRPRLPPRISVK